MTYRPYYDDIDDAPFHKRHTQNPGLAILASQIIGDDVSRPKPFQGQPLCAETDPDLFFPEPGENNVSRAARAICERCPMRAECLEMALQNREQFGVWGGRTLTGRRAEQAVAS